MLTDFNYQKYLNLLGDWQKQNSLAKSARFPQAWTWGNCPHPSKPPKYPIIIYQPEVDVPYLAEQVQQVPFFVLPAITYCSLRLWPLQHSATYLSRVFYVSLKKLVHFLARWWEVSFVCFLARWRQGGLGWFCWRVSHESTASGWRYWCKWGVSFEPQHWNSLSHT